MEEYEQTDRLYRNPLGGPADVADFVLEGDAAVTFPRGRLRLESDRRPDADETGSGFVYWCPESFPDEIAVSWDFWPVAEPGTCTLFFAAQRRGDAALFEAGTDERSGERVEPDGGEMDALRASYYRRAGGDEGAFQTIELRKSPGSSLVARGGDPMPTVAEADPPYRLTVVKYGPEVAFYVDDLEVFTWTADSGSVPDGGRIGFRQSPPFVGEYADLTVRRVEAA